MADEQSKAPSKFHRRLNLDGTIDAICPVCYRTVATSKAESHLVADERIHVCVDGIVMQRGAPLLIKGDD
jgi:hypothetical protein